MTQLGSIFEPEAAGPRGRDLHADVTVPAWALGVPNGIDVRVPLDLAAEGGYARRVVHAGDTGDQIRLCLPAGFPDGGVLRLRGQGEAHDGGRPGDLLVHVEVDRARAEAPPEVRALLAAMAAAAPAPPSANQPVPYTPPRPNSEFVTVVALLVALIAALAVFSR